MTKFCWRARLLFSILGMMLSAQTMADGPADWFVKVYNIGSGNLNGTLVTCGQVWTLTNYTLQKVVVTEAMTMAQSVTGWTWEALQAAKFGATTMMPQIGCTARGPVFVKTGLRTAVTTIAGNTTTVAASDVAAGTFGVSVGGLGLGAACAYTLFPFADWASMQIAKGLGAMQIPDTTNRTFLDAWNSSCTFGAPMY